ncbi:beta-ketoacyl synthase [Halopseudomonas salegens]|uniref:Acetoacetyl-[acyl-carrier protein] synthase n=1 Tax=Halopseudomonas salegens TaxID=1434072 RepID=A0A1H2HXS5_9GAMM|nr:beta-ketoacyl synthase [Halopseudomonas salegens]SDU36569.1 acetoacetyl-[acyl-carrier protein] synthase [Halopseudomonas salegens]
MSRLPVIVGFGGFNAAGRSSGHHGFRRTVLESLPAADRQETLAGLAVLMQLVKVSNDCYVDDEGQVLTLAEIEQRFGQQILDGTLVRRIEKRHLDVDAAHWQKNLTVTGEAGKPFSFMTLAKQLPEPLPTDWVVEPLNATDVMVTVYDGCDLKVDSYRSLAVKSAGQLPSGFEPGELYPSRFHPRGLQLTITAASDALHSSGLNWDAVMAEIEPDQVAVFASSIMSQVDDNSFAGLMQSRLKGGRVTAKQLPLGLNSMPADFINAYVLGSFGTTGAVTGACASFLYNLQKGIDMLASGRARVVLVGSAEAPITQECIEGYGAMTALATEDGLRAIEGRDEVDFRRASRPFGQNCGFTLAESGQFVMLMDDELALQLGADIHGAVTDVFINADGYKKSISAPGPGNYLTMAKAVHSAMQILGPDRVRRNSFVHAHGSSTPGNRTSESELLDRVAAAFDILRWPVVAAKAFVGHSLASASGDQLISALGSFRYQLLPGIKTIDQIAPDVRHQHLDFCLKDRASETPLEACFINSKGFGGNNASAVVLAPQVAEKMLAKRYGEAVFADYCQRREATRSKARSYDQQALKGQLATLYHFGKGMLNDADIELSDSGIHMPGYAKSLSFKVDERFKDML